MGVPKTIYCPLCKSVVGTYDGRSTVNYVARCNKCRKRVVYYIDTGETEIKPLPPRTTPSGTTFI